MKRIFVWLSTVLISLFLLLTIYTNKHVIIFSSYESINIVGKRDDMRTISRETFTSTLNELAEKSESIIARRIVEPQRDGKTRFAYDIYGEGELPKEIQVASEQTSLTSDLVSSYLILVPGSLSSQKLSTDIYELGFKNVIFPSESPIKALISVSVNETSIIGLVLLLLTWISIVLIYSIKDLRAAGIRYISGWDYYKILSHAITSDIQLIFIASAVSSLLGVFTFIITNNFQIHMMAIFLLGILAYAVLLVLLSVVLSLIYIINLKGSNLVEILKGKLPLKRLLFLLLIGQLSSTVAVGWTFNSLLNHHKEIAIKEKAARDWERNKDYFQLTFSYRAAMGGEKAEQKLNKKWYDFARETIDKGNSLFIYSAIEQLYYENIFNKEQSVNSHQDAPIIFVTPNYLKEAKSNFNESFIQKMNKLSLGEFGLVIPERLSSHKADIEKLVEKRMSGFASVDLFPEHEHLFNVEAITTIAKKSRNYFIYNTSQSVSTQYLEDPIIIVTTPQAMGDTPSSHLFWGANIATSLHMKNYDRIEEKLKESGLYQSVAYILNDRLSYLTVLNDNRLAFAILTVGTLLGFLTSILLFDTMHLLYFEQFRRDILIKRLAGLTFGEIHKNYLLLQTITLFIGGVILSFISRQIIIGILVPSLFVFNTILILYVKSIRENKVAITVLKGK